MHNSNFKHTQFFGVEFIAIGCNLYLRQIVSEYLENVQFRISNSFYKCQLITDEKLIEGKFR